MITNVQIINVPVTDQDRAREFYVDTLGLDLVADLSMGPHGRWLQVGASGARTTLALEPDLMPAGSLRGLVLETADIDAAVAQLQTRGVEFPAGIEDMPWARVARFADPDGNGLALQSPPRTMS